VQFAEGSIYFYSLRQELKEIKPYQVLMFVAAVLVLLAPVVYFAPDGGWEFGKVKAKFLTYENFMHPKKQENADITDIIADIDTSMTITDDPLLTHQNGSDGDMGAPSGGGTEVESATELLMNETGEKNLHAFFKTLSAVASQKEKISILHYGDSQIEGDRMTSYIRQKVQDQFGGNGPGLIPAVNVYNTFTFKQEVSKNFTRYTAFGGDALTSRKYGAMASAARFTPEYDVDSTFNLDTIQEQTGWIEFEPSNVAYSRAKKYNNVILHYNSCVAPTMLKVYQNGNLIHEEKLIEDGNQHALKLSFKATPGKLKYEFTGKISPNICAFSLDGDYGVQVSNIAMRGSSGTLFGRLNQETLKNMYSELNTKLVVMQFGGNSVPFFKDSLSVRNFTGYFKSQINRIKNLNPGAMVIVIGPSDMSLLEDGIYETYPFLPYCVEQMIEVTKSAGGAYWNLYAAMGGHNSMPAWVEKGLAGKDYIHFSNGGAKIASQLFYNAFIAEYGKWKKEE
jgi:hypothetical protein